MVTNKSLAVLIPLLCLFFFAIASHAATTTAPATDCSNLILKLADCLTFVSNGSTEAKPQGTCCSGLKTVLNTNAQCLCDNFKNIGQYGISVNITRVLSLPSTCSVTSPAASICGLSLGGTSSSPAPSPASTAGALPAATVPPPPNKASSTLGGAYAGSTIVMLLAAAAL